MRKVFVLICVAALLVIAGCAQQAQNAEEKSPMPGSDRDSHGCIGSAGYTWCDITQKCIRQWEENCTAAKPAAEEKQQMDGSDRDSHGCIGSAGYTWCDEKQKCLRVWEENCTASGTQMVGNDRDAHGCIGSAGYTWCAEKGKCLRVWEENCTANTANARMAKARTFCQDPAAAQVSICGDVIKVVSEMPGAGSTFYYDNGTEVRCPLVSPDYITVQCNLLTLGSNCIQQVVCGEGAKPQLRIVTEEFPPFNFMGADNKLMGSSTEIAQEIIKRTKQDATIDSMAWEDAYRAAIVGPTTMIYSTARTAAREKVFKWAGPIGRWNLTLYTLSNSALKISDVESAKKAGKVCVVKYDARYQYLVENDFDNLLVVKSDEECPKMLAAGEAQLWLGSSTSFNGIISNSGMKAGQFKPVLTASSEEIYFAFSRDTPDKTVDIWQKNVDAMKKDGTYDAIMKKYAG